MVWHTCGTGYGLCDRKSMLCMVYVSVYMECMCGKVQCVECGVCGGAHSVGKNSEYRVWCGEAWCVWYVQ